MKGNLKQRLVAVALCIAMIVSSVNLSNIFKNDINATSLSTSLEEYSYSYTGQVQTFTAPYTGKYYFEVVGAGGGGSGTYVNSGYGGKSSGYYNLYQGDKLYIQVGGKGSIGGKGGYNGGGDSSYSLSGSGGGATSITTTNKGTLDMYDKNKNEVLIVAGGGGGISNLYDRTLYMQSIYSDGFFTQGAGNGGGYAASGVNRNVSDSTHWNGGIPCSIGGTQTSGFSFGKGQNATTSSNGGYAGAGGGGFYGGYAGNDGRAGGAGGSGYIGSVYNGKTDYFTNIGDGYALIRYEGDANSSIIINTNDGGTYENKEGTITLEGTVGSIVNISIPVPKDGYEFIGWELSTETDITTFIGSSLTYDFKPIKLKAIWKAPLILDVSQDESNNLNLTYIQQDNFNKIYKVYQSYDNESWSFAESNTDDLESFNETYTYDYTGSIKTLPLKSGIYILEVYGAQGGATYGGAGGYSKGTYIHKTNSGTMYIVVGGKGSYTSNSSGGAGGYNGGGAGGNGYGGWYGGSGGGGATHIALRNGLLSSLASYKNDVLIVAGGGGGVAGGQHYSAAYIYPGGTGGGENGETAINQNTKSTVAYGGTQTSGYAFGQGAKGTNGGSVGMGSGEGYGGGGGGWYGGRTNGNNTSYNQCVGGGGGSGYIGTLQEAYTESGKRQGNGYAKITYTNATTSISQLREVKFKDINAPNIPSNGQTIATKDGIIISWQNNGDVGTTIYHKVESYDADTNDLLNTSDISQNDVKSGIKGYYYYIDTNENGTATTLNSKYVSNAQINDPNAIANSYIHVAAIDNAGNLSETYSFKIKSISTYAVIHQQEQLNGTYKTIDTEELTGTIGSSITPAVKTYEGFTSPSTQTIKIAADGTTVVNYYYTRNSYPVTYIDVVDSINGKQLGKSTDKLPYETTATGATKGTDTADNKYYNGYYYSSCTTETVGTNGATVYRIFKLRTLDINGSVNWNDKSNAYSSRQENVTITLFRNGTKIDTVTGLTDKDNNTFSFKGLPKYDTTTGEAYVYTVSQSDVVSNHNPEEKYTTDVDSTGFNFTNTLTNSTKEDPEPEWVGFEVNGSIVWEDYDDQLGIRPNNIEIKLYQNGVLHKTQVIDKNATGYSFVNLDKYDETQVPYTYQVEEVFTSKVLTWNSTTKQYETIDAYSIKVDGFDFTNKLVDTKEKPIIPVKPSHINTLTIKLDFNENIDWTEIEKTSNDVNVFVTLKQMETLINDGNISYTSNYNGMEYKSIVNELGVTINNISSGKYEIVESNDNTFVLEEINLQTNSSISVINENNKWYLIIAETNQNQSGTIILNMNIDSFNGYDDSAKVSNLYKIGDKTSSAQVMMMSMFSDEITVPEYVEPITYTITYKNCDVVDDTKYSENSETTLKDCEIEGFLGWSEDSEAVEPQYIAGDKVKLEKDLILYPVIETSEQSSEETTEEENSEKETSNEIEEPSESKETTEETIEEDETSEKKTSSEIEESEENNDSVENSEKLSDNQKHKMTI